MSSTVTITLSQEHLNVVAAALAELPFKHSAPVIDAIRQQLASAAPAEKEAPAVKKKD
jgi:hypothetical protein